MCRNQKQMGWPLHPKMPTGFPVNLPIFFKDTLLIFHITLKLRPIEDLRIAQLQGICSPWMSKHFCFANSLLWNPWREGLFSVLLNVALVGPEVPLLHLNHPALLRPSPTTRTELQISRQLLLAASPPVNHPLPDSHLPR